VEIPEYADRVDGFAGFSDGKAGFIVTRLNFGPIGPRLCTQDSSRAGFADCTGEEQSNEQIENHEGSDVLGFGLRWQG
jgi:hypothetical protein